jgi:predicted MPP superfamily phosphohydrolase
LKSYRVDLQLSGHTHGGQICFPGTKQAMLPLTRYMFPQFIRKMLTIEHLIHVVKHWEWSQGYFELENNDGETNALYVNRGLGSHLRIRLSCPPEVTVLTIFKS